MKIKRTLGDAVFDTIVVIFLGVCAFVALYPMYIIIIASFSDPYAVMRGEVLLIPKSFSLEGYTKLLQSAKIWRAYLNTIIYTTVGTLLNVIFTVMAGYALSRKFAGKKFINFIFVFTMFFSGGLIPTFLAVKNYGLFNNPLVMVVMGLVNVWNIMIARTFLSNSLPDGLYDAAVIDGCGHFQYLIKIALPLSKALLGVLTVYYAVGHWNDFMTGLIYINDQDFKPLQLILRDLLASLQMTDDMMAMVNDMVDLEARMRIAESVKYCSIVISTVPVIGLYLVTQKSFVKGVMIGSIKG